MPLRLLIVTQPPWSVLGTTSADAIPFPVDASGGVSRGPGCQPSDPGRSLYNRGTRLQAVEPSPYHPGLGGRLDRWFLGTPPFRACSFPLRLSSPGRSGDPRVSRSTLPVCHGNHSRCKAAHSSREVTSQAHASLYACHHLSEDGYRSQLLRCRRTNGASLGARPIWDRTCEDGVCRFRGLIPRCSIKNPYVSRRVKNQSCQHNKI